MTRERRPAEARALDAWERGAAASPARRALLLLSLALPAERAGALADLPVGARDAHLFRLRRALFGGRMACGAACPRCGEPLEFGLGVDEVLSGAAPPEPGATFPVSRDGWELEVRLPTTRDLLLLAEGPPPADPARALFARCVVRARRGDEEADVSALPDTLREVAEARMGEADAASQVLLSLACPACGHAWEAPFDVAAFLWSELDAWARRLTAEVHALASRYGWSERQVLSLGARRRRRYLELVGA